MLMTASLFNWSCTRLKDGPNIKLFELFKLVGVDLILSVALSREFQLVAVFCFGISVVLLHILGVSECYNTLFLWSPNL